MKSGKVWISGFLALCGLMAVVLVAFAVQADLDLHFVRKIPSPVEAMRLDRNISSVTRWPQWLSNVSSVRLLNGDKLQSGATVELTLIPRRGRSLQTYLILKVLEYQPGKVLRLQLMDDSTGRLTQLFSDMEWALRFVPKEEPKGATQTMIEGMAVAHTQNWKARLFGRLAEGIVMYQVFLPDMIKLAYMQQPFAMDTSQVEKPLY